MVSFIFQGFFNNRRRISLISSLSLGFAFDKSINRKKHYLYTHEKKAISAFLILSIILIFYFQTIFGNGQAFFLLIFGSFSLIAGSDLFVEGAAGFAAKFGVSEHAIGLTIVAFGTSFPEFAFHLSPHYRNMLLYQLEMFSEAMLPTSS